MTPRADGPGPNCALRYQSDGFLGDSKAVMGGQSAGAGFRKGFKAVAVMSDLATVRAGT